MPEDDDWDEDAIETLSEINMSQMQDECIDRCEYLRDEIRLQVIEELELASVSWTEEQVYCHVSAAVDDCKSNCVLPASPTTAEVKQLIMQLTGGIVVKLPNGTSCITGYTYNSQLTQVFDALVDYLNNHYRNLAEVTTVPICVNYASVVTNFLRQNGVTHAQIPDCIDGTGLLGAQTNAPSTPEIYDESATEAACAAYEAGTGSRWNIRVLPRLAGKVIPGRFWRPEGSNNCLACGLKFNGPEFTAAHHAWITKLNASLDDIIGDALVAPRSVSSSTAYLIPDTNSQQKCYDHALRLPELDSVNADIDSSLVAVFNQHVDSLNKYSAGVNGYSEPFRAFQAGLFQETAQPDLRVTQSSYIAGFDENAWRVIDTSHALHEQWRFFGPLTFQFGIPFLQEDSTLSLGQYQRVSWNLVPSVVRDSSIYEVSFETNILGSGYSDATVTTYAGEEFRVMSDSTFSEEFGYFFEADATYGKNYKHLVYHDVGTNQNHVVETIRFFTLETRDLLGTGVCDPEDEIPLCGITNTCDVCVKWDTLTTADRDKFDKVLPKSCAQKEFERLKRVITERYYAALDEVRDEIQTQVELACKPQVSADLFSATTELKLYHFTLYYYDRAGRLVRAVSPKGVDADDAHDNQANPSHGFVSQFANDSRGQLLKKVVPNGGEEKYFYDKYGRLRFIIDPIQAAETSKKLSYIKYDELDRVVETGQVSGLGTQTALETAIDNYLDANWPTTSQARQDVSVFHYDELAEDVSSSGWSGVTGQHAGAKQKNVRLRLSWAEAVPDWTANELDINDLTNVVRTYYSYDPHGSVTTVYNDIPVNDLSDNATGSSRLITQTNFVIDQSTGDIKAVDFQKDVEAERFSHKYEYDESGRLKNVFTSRTGVLWDRDASYTYNLDGSLRREDIGEDLVQGIDYTYTLLGQIKGINHPSLTASKEPGEDGVSGGENEYVAPDVFGMGFSYHTDDFDRTHSSVPSSFNDAETSLVGVTSDLYSGLIGGWSHRTLATGDASIERDGELVGERFKHDKLGRLRSAITYEFSSSFTSDGSGGWSAFFQLDPNSNLLTIERWSDDIGGANNNHDDVRLGYLSNSNLINEVDESATSVAGYDEELDDAAPADITEDAKGRVTGMEIGSVDNSTSYTSYDLANELVRDGTKLVIIRDAFGTKVRTDVLDASNDDLQERIYVIPGTINADVAIYKLDGEATTPPSIDEWGIEGLGRIGHSRNTNDVISTHNGEEVYKRRIGEKRYEITDHLGSVRAIVSDVKLVDGSDFEADLLAVRDYDPYGNSRRNRRLDITNEDYRFGFQGMREFDGLVGQSEYDTPFRMYDGKTGRWGAIDPIIQPQESGYSGLAGLPTMMIDRLGLDELPESYQPRSKNESVKFRAISPSAYTGAIVPAGNQTGALIISEAVKNGDVVRQAPEGIFERQGIQYTPWVDSDAKGVYYTAVPIEAQEAGEIPQPMIVSPEVAKEIHQGSYLGRTFAWAINNSYGPNSIDLTAMAKDGAMAEVRHQWSELTVIDIIMLTVGVTGGMLEALPSRTAIKRVSRIIKTGKRTGSAMKEDAHHRAASWVTTEQIEKGRVTVITSKLKKGKIKKGKSRTEGQVMLQTKGQVNGRDGIFEFIIDNEDVIVHQRFIPGGRYTTYPNQSVRK